jgi:hypothetical protein
MEPTVTDRFPDLVVLLHGHLACLTLELPPLLCEEQKAQSSAC